jgi:hypothetical protein
LTPDSQSAALVLWVDILGVEAGDRIQFRLVGPDSEPVFETDQRVDRRQARRFVYAGKKRQGASWAAGVYRGEVTLQRREMGQIVEHRIGRTATIR